jgi:hypothetical protein
MKKTLTTILIILMGMTQVMAQATITKSGYITSNETWTRNNIYRLSGFVYVDSLATVTIESGTLIYGEKSTKGALIVTRGGKLIAQGTACQPIVFTSEQPAGSRAPGDWGGIILLGRATTNQPGGTAIIEGGVDDGEGNGTYGGGSNPDDNDNSGILQYVRIEYPGIAFQPNNEINGLTMGGVGRGTTIDHVQVSWAGDDAYEWFGGTVNCKYLIAYRSVDDDFDSDNGYNGKIQYAVGLRDPNVADISGSNGFETDNDATGTTNLPQTNPLFSNVSIFGPLATTSTSINSNYKRGAHIRRNSACSIYNSILSGYPDGAFIDGTLSQDNWCNGVLDFDYNFVSGWTLNSATPTSGGTSGCFTAAGFLGTSTTYTDNASLQITDPFNLSAPDFLPLGGSPVLSGANFSWTTDPFFDAVSYRGAFGDVDWTEPWANWDPQNTTYTGATNFTPTITATTTKSTCPNTGAVNITVTPAASYAYSWSNGATTEDISNVAAGSYTVTVSRGLCAASKTSTVASGQIPKPSGLTSNPSSCSITLTWNSVSVASGYNVRYRKTGTTTWTTISGSISTTSYTFTGLTAGTSYDLNVRTICASSSSSKSGWAQTTAMTTNTCALPLNAAASGVTQTTATISWTGTCNALSYDVQYRKTGVITWTTVNTTATSTTLTGLTANTGYDYRIRTKCSGTNSAYTAIQNFTTTLRVTDEDADLLAKGIVIYPNPAQDNVTIEIETASPKTLNVRLLNSLGQSVAAQNNVQVDGKQQLHFNLNSLTSGTYFVNIYDGQESLSYQLIINR